MLLKFSINSSLIAIMTVLLSFSACKNKATEASASEQPVYQSPEFQDFYKRFSTDSVYQLEHVVFPLEGMRAPVDTADVTDPDFRWKMEDWVIHKPYDDANGTFIREFNSINGVVIEKISDNSGTFSMERRFGKLSSGWHLIYYRELGKY